MEYGLEKAHEVNLKILKEVDRICRKYKIQYLLVTSALNFIILSYCLNIFKAIFSLGVSSQVVLLFSDATILFIALR